MKLNKLIEINQMAQEALSAYQKHYPVDTVQKISMNVEITMPLVKIIGMTNALIWIHSHNVEVEVK